MINKINKVGRYENGEAWVEFEEDGLTPHTHIDFNGNISYEWKTSFMLVESELVKRIERGIQNNQDVSKEQDALFMMRDKIINP